MPGSQGPFGWHCSARPRRASVRSVSLVGVPTRAVPVLLRSPWLPFGLLIAAAWLLLFRHHQVTAGGSVSSSGHGAATLAGLWALMAVAMMAPTAVPVLASLREITARSSSLPWWAFLGGYLVVWLGFSVLATGMQLVAADLSLVDHSGRSTERWLTASLLLAAGAYQFSPLKQRCVTACAAPMTFFLRHWRGGTDGGLRMGLRSGITCLGCCWALMLLGFVGGVHSLAFMGLGVLIMAVEKLPGLARLVTVPLGLALLGGGLAVLVGLVSPAGDRPTNPDHDHHHATTHLTGTAQMEHLPWTPG